MNLEPNFGTKILKKFSDSLPQRSLSLEVPPGYVFGLHNRKKKKQMGGKMWLGHLCYSITMSNLLEYKLH